MLRLRAARWGLFLLELFYGFQDYVANGGQAFGADFVDVVLRSVPVVAGVVQVDDIDRRDLAGSEGKMVVRRALRSRYEDLAIA